MVVLYEIQYSFHRLSIDLNRNDMKTENKQAAAGVYFMIALFCMFGEPSNEKNEYLYYGIVITNMFIAALLLKHYDNKRRNESSRNIN